MLSSLGCQCPRLMAMRLGAHDGRPPDSDYSVYGENFVIYDVCYAVIDAVVCCHCYYSMLSLMLSYAVIPRLPVSKTHGKEAG